TARGGADGGIRRDHRPPHGHLAAPCTALPCWATVLAPGMRHLAVDLQPGNHLLVALAQDHSPPARLPASWGAGRRWIPQPLTGASGSSATRAGWRSSRRFSFAPYSTSARSDRASLTGPT